MCLDFIQFCVAFQDSFRDYVFRKTFVLVLASRRFVDFKNIWSMVNNCVYFALRWLSWIVKSGVYQCKSLFVSYPTCYWFALLTDFVQIHTSISGALSQHHDPTCYWFALLTDLVQIHTSISGALSQHHDPRHNTLDWRKYMSWTSVNGIWSGVELCIRVHGFVSTTLFDFASSCREFSMIDELGEISSRSLQYHHLLASSAKVVPVCLEFWYTFCISKPFWKSHLFGTPVGQASNPGPNWLQPFRFAVTNPTAILAKEDVYHHLSQHHDITTFVAAETSATLMAQKAFQSKIRSKGFTVSWSPPVPDQKQRSDGAPSYRGKASGVAVISKFPLRMAVNTLAPEWEATSRIRHSVISLGKFQIQIVAVYGLTASPDHMSINNALFQDIFQAIRALNLPTIIAGDFNCLPEALDCYPDFQHLGFVDLRKIYRTKYQQEMPCTCRDVTWPDNAIVCPQVSRWIQNIEVLPTYFFDTHKTVVFDLCIPQGEIFQWGLPMPKTWIGLPLETHHVQVAYDQATRDLGQPTSIEDWGTTVEHSIDLAYRFTQMEHNKTSFVQTKPLPMKFQGRCKPRKPRKIFLQGLTKLAREGDFNPSHEVHSYTSFHKITQVRRIQALLRRIRKQSTSVLSMQTRFEMQLEWDAILRNKSFQSNFVSWCISQPEIGPPPCDVPSLELLLIIYQLAKHEVDAQVAFEHQAWIKKIDYQRMLDFKLGGASHAHSKLKVDTPPPLTAISNPVKETALWAPGDVGQILLFCDNTTEFRKHFVTYVNDVPCALVDIANDHLVVTPNQSWTDDIPEDVVISQRQVLANPQDIFDQLCAFWDPYWNKDPEDIQLTGEFQAFLDQMSVNFPPPAINLQDESEWELAIRQLRSSSCRGIDAISAAELKMLPVEAIRDLSKILISYENGFPDWFMTSITFALSKTNDLPVASQTRPITVMKCPNCTDCGQKLCVNNLFVISPSTLGLISLDSFVLEDRWMLRFCNNGGLNFIIPKEQQLVVLAWIL